MKTAKKVCCLYRAESIEADQAEINRQRSLCLQYAKAHGWSVLREYRSKKDCPNEPQNMDDPLMELCAEAKKENLTSCLLQSLTKWDVYQWNVLMPQRFLSGITLRFGKPKAAILEHMSVTGSCKEL